MINVATHVIQSQLLVGIAMSIAYRYSQIFFNITPSNDIPHPIVMIIHIFLHATFFSIWYYFFHRLSQNSKYYKVIHKLHHKYDAPFAMMALYADVLEEIFINFLPTLLSPLIFQSHVLILWIWLFVVGYSSTRAHSGYATPYTGSARRHDLHHSHPNGNDGVLLDFLDKYYGTDQIEDRLIKRVQETRERIFQTFDLSQEDIDQLMKGGPLRTDKEKIRNILSQEKIEINDIAQALSELVDFFPTKFKYRVEYALEHPELTNEELYLLFYNDLKYLYSNRSLE